MNPIPLVPRETWRFGTERIGRRILVYDHVDSTNTLAMTLAQTEPDADGLVVVADHQVAGRGQYGRVWVSRPGSSLLMSAVIRPPAELRRPVILTALATVAVAKTVRALTGVEPVIKWPNDLLVRSKKVCGILIEQSSTATGMTTVAGIGLNVAQTADEFAQANLPDATSLTAIAGKPLDTRTAAKLVTESLDREYSRLLTGERAGVEADWKQRTELVGRRVAIEHFGGEISVGHLRDMAFDGLEVEDANGVTRVLVPESVSHIRAV